MIPRPRIPYGSVTRENHLILTASRKIAANHLLRGFGITQNHSRRVVRPHPPPLGGGLTRITHPAGTEPEALKPVVNVIVITVRQGR